MLNSLGADNVIDYTKEDFTKSGKTYDLIIDVVANRSIFKYKNSLNSNGVFIMIGGATSSILQAVLFGPFIKDAGKKLGILFHESNKNLEFLKELFDSGVLTKEEFEKAKKKLLN